MNHFQKPYKSLKLVYHLIRVLCRKIASTLEPQIIFDERLKVTSVPFSIPESNLLYCEFYIYIYLLYCEFWKFYV